MVNERKNKLIQSGELDVYWNTTNKHFENELLAVRIPLLKGLMGWRLMLVHKEQAEALASVTNIQQLQKYIAGQGRDWNDTKILEFNKFNVASITYKSSIMELLERKRIDYYPRSILEIWSDLDVFETANIVVDQSMAFYYPLAVHYFVREDNTQLHDIIYKGLDTAIEDGSFEQLCRKFFANVI
jgi:hypothetical protein